MFEIEFTKSSGIESRPIDTIIVVEVSKLQYKSGGSWQQHHQHHIPTTIGTTPF